MMTDLRESKINLFQLKTIGFLGQLCDENSDAAGSLGLGFTPSTPGLSPKEIKGSCFCVTGEQKRSENTFYREDKKQQGLREEMAMWECQSR